MSSVNNPDIWYPTIFAIIIISALSLVFYKLYAESQTCTNSIQMFVAGNEYKCHAKGKLTIKDNMVYCTCENAP